VLKVEMNVEADNQPQPNWQQSTCHLLAVAGSQQLATIHFAICASS
jgi:hypothetical protein